MRNVIHVKAILQNPEGVYEENINANFGNIPPAQLEEAKKAAIGQTLALYANGIIHEVKKDHVCIIPLHRIQSLEIEIDSVSIADNLDVASIARQTGASTLANLHK